MVELVQSFASENIALNTPVTFDTTIPCPYGHVYHQNGTGTTILRGIPNCPCDKIARYSVTLNGNIAIPTGGAVTPIAMAITVSGEARQSSKAIFTPAAVDEFGNITSTASVDVPRGCCLIISAEYVDATTADAATTPTPVITIENGSMIINQTR
jgi:hypothetical protein